MDDHFKVAHKDFLEAMIGESDKRAKHDNALLAWDKEKHSVLAGFKLRKHRECIAQQERMTVEISEALKDVSNSFRFFASEMARRM